jgi:diguanylate cyclase (GGDEF)-like protein
MVAPFLPREEARRVRGLHALSILDTPPQDRFDRLTRLACRLFDVPIALVSLVDEDRLWFKSHAGWGASEPSKAWSFCAAATQGDDVVVVPDAAADARFSENPLVLGDPQIRFYAGCPLRAADGTHLGTLCVIDRQPRELRDGDAHLLTDLAGLVENELRAIQLASLDPLTGLTNRRGFDTIALHTLALCDRVERPATLLLFDLDNLKQINDKHGHSEGDRVLRDFADQLLVSFRNSDVVARLGGDEFCVLLSGTEGEAARVPLRLLDRRLEGEDGRPRVTYSVGVAPYDSERHSSAAMLLEDADARMYAHKRARGHS